jgi:hypothetical protein
VKETDILTWMKLAGRQLGAIALLAMLVRALVPAGYMLAEADTPNGRYLVVQMCESHAAAPQVFDLDTGQLVEASNLPAKPGGKSDNSACVFALSASMASPPAAVEPVVFRTAFAADLVVAPVVFPGRGIAAPPPPSTGPPALI